MTAVFNRVMFVMAFCSLQLVTSAQNEVDALRYSQTSPFGSARYTAMGGAFGALGGDFSAISFNPAGIGIYRRSTTSLSLGLIDQHSTSVYEQNSVFDDAYRMNIPQIGIVSTSKPSDQNWTRFSFGVGYNQLKNFNESFTVSGNALNTSLTEIFVLQAQGIPGEELTNSFPFGAGLAWESYLINPADTTDANNYISAIPYGSLKQTNVVERRGRMGETVLAFGGSYQDRLYLGLSLGFPVVRFEEKSSYTESDVDPDLDIQDYTINQELFTSGNGINVKLGGIYRVTNQFRVGASWHSPSFISLNDTYETSVVSRFKNGDTYSANSPYGTFEYGLRTPSRYTTSAAYILGKLGVVSADYEFVDYSKAKLRTASSILYSGDFTQENGVIRDIYRGTHNIKLGLEMRVADYWRLRAGAGLSQSPYVEGATTLTTNIITYSGGFGYRGQSFFVEAGYSFQESDKDWYLYDPQRVDAASLKSSQGQGVITVGFAY
jgi:hypothetical protein